MKKLMLIIITIVFLGGCGGFQIQKSPDTSDPNVFHTIVPKVKIKIDKDFVLVSERNWEHRRRFNVVTKQYYGPKDYTKYLSYVWKSKSAIIYLLITSLPYQEFIKPDNILTFKQSVIQEKNETLGDKIWRTGFSSDANDAALAKRLRDLGANIRGNRLGDKDRVCFFRKTLAKKFLKKVYIEINYIETAPEDAYFYTDKIAMEMTKDREQFISNLMKRADAAITIME